MGSRARSVANRPHHHSETVSSMEGGRGRPRPAYRRAIRCCPRPRRRARRQSTGKAGRKAAVSASGYERAADLESAVPHMRVVPTHPPTPYPLPENVATLPRMCNAVLASGLSVLDRSRRYIVVAQLPTATVTVACVVLRKEYEPGSHRWSINRRQHVSRRGSTHV